MIINKINHHLGGPPISS